MQLTIAIPTYNRQARVAALVDGIRAQMLPGDELIVSDDASGDGTADRLAAVPGVTVHRHPTRLGMVGNWNFCLTAGRNDWVCLAHDDDRLTPGGLAAIRRVCVEAKGPSLIAHAEWERHDQPADPGSGLGYEVREPGTSACLRAEFCPSGVTIHRAVIAAVGGFDPEYRYSADMEFFPRVCARFPSYVIRNPRVLEYVMHDDNYQLKTWREPDFLDHLERVETAAVAHAGLDPAAARRVVEARMIRDMAYMLRTAKVAGDARSVRSVSAALKRRGPPGRRLRLASTMGRLLGWYPRRLLPG